MVGEDSYNTSFEHVRAKTYRVRLRSSNITVQPGDVVGCFIVHDFIRVRRLEGVVLDTNYKTESVWYHGNTTKLPLEMGPDYCQASVGPNGTLRSFIDAAPMLSVGIGKLSSSNRLHQGCMIA